MSMWVYMLYPLYRGWQTTEPRVYYVWDEIVYKRRYMFINSNTHMCWMYAIWLLKSRKIVRGGGVVRSICSRLVSRAGTVYIYIYLNNIWHEPIKRIRRRCCGCAVSGSAPQHGYDGVAWRVVKLWQNFVWKNHKNISMLKTNSKTNTNILTMYNFNFNCSPCQ